MSRVRLAWRGFLSSKLTIFQSKMKVLQGQRIHTLLCHTYSALSLIYNLSVLSEGRYPHAARADPAIKYMTQKALVHACSAWAIRVSKAQICCSGHQERDIVDRPIQFKLHQSYRPLTCFIREFNPACKKSGRVPRNADSFLLQIPCKKSAVMTLTPWSASYYRGDAVIITALVSATDNFISNIV